MKNILYICLFGLLMTSCGDDAIEGVAVTFYPNKTIRADETSGTIHIISLETTGEVAGSSQVVIDVENGDFITFNPAPVNNQITLTFNGTETESFTAQVADDGEKLGYNATFTISSVSGSINEIVNGTFTMIVGGLEGCGEEVSRPDISLPFSDDFEGCVDAGDYNILDGWFEEIVPGFKTDRGWGCRSFGRTGSAPACSAFGGEAGEDNAWLISDGKLNLTGETTVNLEFWTESPFSGDGDLKVLWSSDYVGQGNPECANWTELTDIQAQLPAGGSRVWTQITSDLSGAAGQKVYLAFQYLNAPNSNAISFNVDDLAITGN